MKMLKLVAVLLFVVWAILPTLGRGVVRSQGVASVDSDPIAPQCIPTEAATGFDDRSINQNFVTDA